MEKDSSVRPGDIVAISLGEGMVAAGIVLHVSARVKDGVLMGFYDHLYDSLDAINVRNLGSVFIETPNYTGKKLLTGGQWKIIGNSPESLAEAVVPELRAAYTLYYKDESVRQLSPGELSDYTELRVEGRVFVENKLRKHFGEG